MSELGNVAAQNVVSSGNGWSVGRTANGFTVRIDYADGPGFFGVDIAHPATDDQREEARDQLADLAQDTVELDRIQEAFAAPWQQA